MGNQLALKVQTQSGDQLVLEDGCHIYRYEGGAPAALNGLLTACIPSLDGSLTWDMISPVLNPDDDLSMRTWHYWTRSNQNYLGNSYRLLLTDKWEAEAGIQYDLYHSRWADKMMIIRRRAHQWLFEFKFEVDEGDDDTSFTVSIAPLALMGQGNKGSIYDPMLGN